MLWVDGRGGFQRTGGIQGVGAILAKAHADRERDRNRFARVSSKRRRTGFLERMATRNTERMRDRHRDKTGSVRALRFCHVDSGALFRLGMRCIARMQHEQSRSSADSSAARSFRPRCTVPARRWTAIASSGGHVVNSLRQGTEIGYQTVLCVIHFDGDCRAANENHGNYRLPAEIIGEPGL